MNERFARVEKILDWNLSLLNRQERMGFVVSANPISSLCLERDGVKHNYEIGSDRLLRRLACVQ